MKALLRALVWPFRQRWLVSLLGALLLMALVWWVGPVVAIGEAVPLRPEANRWIVVAAIALLWLGAQALRRWRAWRMNRALMADLTAPPPPSPDEQATADEIALLHENLRDALAVMAGPSAGPLRPGGRMLYELPWYLLIGPPGSGKTTALLNSGLRFPAENRLGRAAVRGVAGTRHCDWFLTDEAVLIDTAGRYATQASQPTDAGAWLGFLDLLKRYRPRQPLNGVLIAFDLPGLLDAGPGERDAHVRAVRQRLQELRGRLGTEAPAYVVFTKLDLIAGFRETFDRLDTDGRAQPWGVTFAGAGAPPAAAVALEQLPGELERLMARLQQQLLPRLEAEGDAQRRGLILGFPTEMAAAMPVVEAFVRALFEPTRFEPAALVRGVYFTSGTQEQTPIDRVMSGIAQSFGLSPRELPAFSRAGSSHFVTGLLRRVVFAEAGLAGTDTAHERRRRALELAALAGIALVSVGMAAAWAASYAGNRSLLEEARRRAEADGAKVAMLASTDPSLRTVLPAFDALRGFPAGYAERDHWTPIGLRGGLYQGEEIGEAAIAAYARALDGALLPRLRLQLEARLAATAAEPEALFRTLKTYLMLAVGDGPLDATAVRAWFEEEWARVFATAPPDVPRRLLEHLDALLERGFTRFQPNEPLVRQARVALAQHSAALRAYAQLRQSPTAAPPWRLTDGTPASLPRLFRRASDRPLSEPMPGFFTRAGFEEVLRGRLGGLADAVAAEAWVMGPEASGGLSRAETEGLQRQVLELYLTAYARAWGEFVDGLDFAPASNLSQLVEQLALLTADPSPLRAVLAAIAAQTQLGAEPPGPLQSRLGALQEAARQALQRISGAGAGGPPPTDFVDRRFAAIAAAVRPQGDQPPPVEAVVVQLRELLVQLNALLQAGNRGEAPIGGPVQQAIGRLQVTAQQLPGAPGKLAGTAASQANAVVFGAARQQVQAVWATQVFPFCRENLAGRYPLARGSARDATLADFARFLGPNGLADQFYEQHLRSFVDRSVRPWRILPVGGAAAGLSVAGVSQLERAAQLRDAFFEGGSAQPQASFEIAPTGLSEAAGRALLALGEQSLTNDHGPARPVRLRWPGTDGGLEARVVLTALAGGRTEVISATGTWAWFRLLDRAQLERLPGRDSYRVTFTAGDLWARYEIRPGSVDNPLAQRDRPSFQCSERM
jgi:type VI secretion system protein ImpL